MHVKSELRKAYQAKPSVKSPDYDDYMASIDAKLCSGSGTVEQFSGSVLREKCVTLFLNGESFVKLTCTPCDVVALAVGHLFTQGRIDSVADIADLRYDERCRSVYITTGTEPTLFDGVRTVSTTGCYEVQPKECSMAAAPADGLPKSAPWDLAEVLRIYQEFTSDTVFHALTGGTHSCRLVYGGKVVFTVEDIGRHNALDKTIGYALLHGLDLRQAMVFSSGRVPVDMARKAVRAHLSVLATKASPTDEAITLCRKAGVGLVTVINDEQALVYSGEENMKVERNREATAACL